jgi:hypothetical protein
MRYNSVLLLLALTGLASTAFAQSSPLVVPPACNPCLWYSGDFDPNNSLATGLWNANAAWNRESAQVFVPFVAASNGTTDKHVEISSITFNELENGAPISDLDGGTYTFLEGVSFGNGGATLKTGDCESLTAADTGVSWSGYELYNFTCALKNSEKVAIGEIYWVNILPTFMTQGFALLANVADNPAPNQMGWSDDYYNSYYNGLGYDFEPTTETDAYNAEGLGEFSVAIAGTYVP